MKATVKPRATFDAPLAAWFARQGWTPAPFQRAAWRHYLAGRDGLLVTPTGNRVLTPKVPREVADIERAMKDRGAWWGKVEPASL